MELGILPQMPPEIIVIDDEEDDEDELGAFPFDGNQFFNQWTSLLDADQLDIDDRNGQSVKTSRTRVPSVSAPSRTYIDLDEDDSSLPVASAGPQTSVPTVESPFVTASTSDNLIKMQGAQEVMPDPEATYLSYKESVLEVFPDVSLDFLTQLYDARLLDSSVDPLSSIAQIVQDSILEISDLKEYPKQKEKKRKSLKRKRDGLETNLEDDPEWAEPGRKYSTVGERLEAQRLLSLNFGKVPSQFIVDQLGKCGNLYSAYWAIEEAERNNKNAANPAFRQLKKTRKSSVPSSGAYPQLQTELEAAQRRSQRNEAARLRKQAEMDAEAALDRQAFEDGDTLECQCCFTDVPTARTTHCHGETPHFFCFDCASSNAKAQLDLSRYKLCCMDGSGCPAEFTRFERHRFLDDDTLARLDRLQQQAELREADLPDLEHCPFCDFAAICPPIEVDREFRCLGPDCELTSCRSCKQISHIPKSCAEHRKEQGIEERHIVEEEMTKALLRRCPKASCGVPIIKADGCNKIICTKCGCYICDVCGNDITKEGYAHFRGGGGKGDCPQSDDTIGRKNKKIEEAAKEAKAKIRAENPDISEDDLEVKFSSQVKGKTTDHGPRHRHRRRMHAPQLPRLPDLGIDQGQQEVGDVLQRNALFREGLRLRDQEMEQQYGAHQRVALPQWNPEPNPAMYQFPQAQHMALPPQPIMTGNNYLNDPYQHMMQPQDRWNMSLNFPAPEPAYQFPHMMPPGYH